MAGPVFKILIKSVDRWMDCWTLTSNSAKTFINTSFTAVSHAWGTDLLQTT